MIEEELFHRALEKPTLAEQLAFLDEVCADQPELRQRVERLLRSHQREDSFLQSGATGAEPVADGPGSLIGPYKLLELIGEGGMGSVWMAQQTEPVKRLVAVKLIKAGMDSRQVIARFEAERQALALMDHPNIARVLDAGATSAGRPYFVMDLVKGVPITRYCDEHRLTPRERLELFLPVCQAVQHAHQKGIIHRDLKPSNVLVALYDGKPVPKVIDFGVAKAAGQPLTEQTLVTGFGAIVGTLEYMSPEQAELNQLDVDTRSDIYSLGVLLYELLTGSPPFSHKELEKAGILEMLRVIREQEPTRPSAKLSTADGLPTLAANRGTEPARLTRLVRGELDWIVMKALEKDRNRRYETANGFAMDVQRYLADEPVLACPPSASYRLRKFARKHRQRLAWAAVLLLAMLGVLGAGLWYQFERSQRQAELTTQRSYLEKEVVQALDQSEQTLQDLHQKLHQPREVVKLLSDQAPWEKRLDQSKAAWQRAASLVGSNEGLLPEAIVVRLGAIEKQLTAGERDLAVARKLDDIRLVGATLIEGKYDPEASRAKYPAAFAAWELDFQKSAPEQLADQIKQSSLRYVLVAALDHWAEVTSLKDELLPRLMAVARLADPDPWRDQVRAPTSWKSKKVLKELAEKGDWAVQSPHTILLLATRLNATGGDGANVLRQALLHHPDDFWLHFYLGHMAKDSQEKVGCFRAALAVRPISVPSYSNLGNALRDQKNLAGAIAAYKKAIELEPNFAKAHSNLGAALRDQKDLDGAIACFQKAIKLQPDMASAHTNLGTALREKKDLAGAVACYHKAIKVQPDFAMAHYNLGVALLDQKDLEGAIACFRKAIKHQPNFVEAHNNLGSALKAQNDLDGAIACFNKAIQIKRDFGMAHHNLGVALFAQKDVEGAIVCYRRAIQLQPDYVDAHLNLGSTLMAKKDLDAAIACFQKVIQLQPAKATAHYSVGLALHAKRDLDGAIAAYRKAIYFKLDNAPVHYNLGVALLDKNDLEGAIACFQKLIQLQPEVAEFHADLGLMFARQKKWDQAIAASEKAIQLKQSVGAPHLNLALWLANCPEPKYRNPQKAAALAKKVVEVASNYPLPWLALGWASYRVGDWEGSIQALKKSMSLQNGGNANHWFGLAMAHWQLGNKAEALTWYEKAASWMDKNASNDVMLQSVRAEAEQLLMIDSKPKPK